MDETSNDAFRQTDRLLTRRVVWQTK